MLCYQLTVPRAAFLAQRSEEPPSSRRNERQDGKHVAAPRAERSVAHDAGGKAEQRALRRWMCVNCDEQEKACLLLVIPL